jgi:pyrimidine deaminase RibD-like protein
MAFNILTAAFMKTTVFWHVEPCSLAGMDQCLRCTYRLSHQMVMKTISASKHLQIFARLQGAT